MEFDGFYYDNKWWTGDTSLSREFNFQSAVNVFAWGALTCVEVTGGGGSAYVGIAEATVVLPDGTEVNEDENSTAANGLPIPNFTARVTSVTWAYGSSWPLAIPPIP
jgi:hypothetical protein